MSMRVYSKDITWASNILPNFFGASPWFGSQTSTSFHHLQPRIKLLQSIIAPSFLHTSANEAYKYNPAPNASPVSKKNLLSISIRPRSNRSNNKPKVDRPCLHAMDCYLQVQRGRNEVPTLSETMSHVSTNSWLPPLLSHKQCPAVQIQDGSIELTRRFWKAEGSEWNGKAYLKSDLKLRVHHATLLGKT